MIWDSPAGTRKDTLSRSVAPLCMTEYGALLRARSPLIDAFIRAAVLPVKTAA